MVEIGAQLMRRKGYLNTSLVEIVAEGGLPRGSIYHHFPEGKPQLAAEAIKHASAEVARDMLEVAARASSAREAIAIYVRMLAERLERSDFADGCWYATTAMEVAGTVPALSEALNHVGETGEQVDYAEMLRLRGELLLMRDRSAMAEAENSFRAALEVARAQEAKWWELRASASLARVLRDTNRRDEARAMLAEIYSWFTEGFDTADLKEAKALLDELINSS